jgi:hypothetical protein
MPMYRNLNGDSGIVAYEVGQDWIEVEFRQGRERFYTYTSASVGSGNLMTMKQLAERGSGLNSFINTRVPKGYYSKR